MEKMYKPEIVKGVFIPSVVSMIGMELDQIVRLQDHEGLLNNCRQSIVTRKWMSKKWN